MSQVPMSKWVGGWVAYTRMVRGAPARGRKLHLFHKLIMYYFLSGISWGVCCPPGLLRPRVCAPSHH